MTDAVSLLASSADSQLLSRNENEFVSFYFSELNKNLRQLRRPPLPPGYRLVDAQDQYEICLLKYGLFHATNENDDNNETSLTLKKNNDTYVRRRLINLLDGLNKGGTGVDLDEVGWEAAINKKWPASN